MENLIRHEGVIDSIEGTLVRVRILQAAACASCKVASKCHTAEMKEKIIDVQCSDTARWKVGQNVTVSTSAHSAGKAALIAFGIPLLLMLVVLVATLSTGCNEGKAALLMLGTVALYYIIVWLCRSRLEKDIAFHLEGTD